MHDGVTVSRVPILSPRRLSDTAAAPPKGKPISSDGELVEKLLCPGNPLFGLLGGRIMPVAALQFYERRIDAPARGFKEVLGAVSMAITWPQGKATLV